MKDFESSGALHEVLVQSVLRQKKDNRVSEEVFGRPRKIAKRKR